MRIGGGGVVSIQHWQGNWHLPCIFTPTLTWTRMVPCMPAAPNFVQCPCPCELHTVCDSEHCWGLGRERGPDFLRTLHVTNNGLHMSCSQNLILGSYPLKGHTELWGYYAGRRIYLCSCREAPTVHTAFGVIHAPNPGA